MWDVGTTHNHPQRVAIVSSSKYIKDYITMPQELEYVMIWTSCTNVGFDRFFKYSKNVSA